MMSRFFKIIPVASILTVLTACSTLPENLASDNPDLQTNYSGWQSSASQEQELRLGGVIASVTNLKDKTRVEVVNLPISSNGKPDINQEPQGRFVGYIDGFADPVTLSQGRLITLLGDSSGTEAAKVGEYSYDFPVMNIKSYHLWRIEERVIVHDDFGSSRYPCRSLYCRDLTRGTRQGKVIQEVK
ncbi:Slp family lipoprotein [Vibrio sp. Isolate23]|uniref:Slp family lipoprotein n=1 Tax=Vibrio sp. Isolate23 TaxID=2908533 RepID=UPI001EFE0913|nr:Slp family lipoprotein [Vibrio sp. Isolate23]MCG9682774.1 Slp family lipoprotein [Vibrio sp. Isolate23]